MRINHNKDKTRIEFSMGGEKTLSVKRLGPRTTRVKEWFARTFHLNALFPNFGAVKLKLQKNDGHCAEEIYLDKRSLMKQYKTGECGDEKAAKKDLKNPKVEERILRLLGATDDGNVYNLEETSLDELQKFQEEFDKFPGVIAEIEHDLSDLTESAITKLEDIANKTSKFGEISDKFKWIVEVQNKFQQSHPEVFRAFINEDLNELTLLFGSCFGLKLNEKHEILNKLKAIHIRMIDYSEFLQTTCLKFR